MRRILTSLLLLLIARPCFANDNDASASWLHSSSHLGFALEDQSTTNFSGNAGSMGFFDFTAAVTENIEVGLRTLMSGARQPGASFYRLGAGPLLSYSPTKEWMISVMTGWFRESCTDKHSAPLYQSRGSITMLGWERFIPIYQRVDVALGGFVGFYSGDIRNLAADFSNPVTKHSPEKNTGRNRGVEIALRVRL